MGPAAPLWRSFALLRWVRGPEMNTRRSEEDVFLRTQLSDFTNLGGVLLEPCSMWCKVAVLLESAQTQLP